MRKVVLYNSVLSGIHVQEARRADEERSGHGRPVATHMGARKPVETHSQNDRRG